MKKVNKREEPNSLRSYSAIMPDSTWEEMKNDLYNSGDAAYRDCREKVIADQGGICAYCEISIRDMNPLTCRVEHFHPKSDSNSIHNWALDWSNMLGCCSGGSNPHISRNGFFLQPLQDNLSCDAHKDRMISKGRLPADCDGVILNPLQICSFPCLFDIEMDSGFLRPNSQACSNFTCFPSNGFSSVEELVQNTIDMLNLNCDRLAQVRKILIDDIEIRKAKEREQGQSPAQGLARIACHYFSTQWPQFFTTIRIRLGSAAEDYLQSINYNG